MKAAIGTVAALSAALAFAGGAFAADGGQVWTASACGACHTLNVTGSHARVGPNLDELAPTAAQVAAKVRSGGGGMPSFSKKLSAADIDAVAAFVSVNAGRLPGMAPLKGTIVATTTGPLPPAADWVKVLQGKLASLGLFTGPQTGVFGPVTAAAVQAFQIKFGLTPDGKWGPASQAALDKALAKKGATATGTTATSTTSSAGSGSATPSSGTSGSSTGTTVPSSTVLPAPAAWVQSLQTKLAKLGYFSGPTNGVLGPITQAAIKTFQTNAGLTPDGKWGPASQAALEKALAKKG